MATVRPFRGIAFDPTQVRDLGKVTCPPYDVISPDGRTELYDRHPYNVVRIVSGRDEAGDTETQNKYTRAAEFFSSWLWEGVLRQEHEPTLYAYRQAFTDPKGGIRRVMGMLGAISLDDEIMAHEHTMSGPKADRLALMRAIPANISPIYALYNEPAGSVSAKLPDFTHDPPAADFVDDEGTRHTAWAIRDTAFHAHVAEALKDCHLHIADGHHRFETAKNYRSERVAADGPGEWNSIMALLVDAGHQPVCILPYHRIVLRSQGDVLSTLESAFEVEKIGPTDPGTANALGLELWDDPGPAVFVAFLEQGAFRLVAPQPGPLEIPAGVLKRLALEPIGAGGAEASLAFSPRASEVAGEVAAGRAVAGFLMQPISVERVWELATAGAKMPEKSTYFFPKPRDGIVMRPLQELS